jgi:hypothetical protein
MSRADADFGIGNLVKMEDHLDMGKSGQAGQGIGRKAAVQFDDGLFAIPRII